MYVREIQKDFFKKFQQCLIMLTYLTVLFSVLLILTSGVAAQICSLGWETPCWTFALWWTKTSLTSKLMEWRIEENKQIFISIGGKEVKNGTCSNNVLDWDVRQQSSAETRTRKKINDHIIILMLIQDNNNLIAKHRKWLVIVISMCTAADVLTDPLYSPEWNWPLMPFFALSNIYLSWLNVSLSYLHAFISKQST